MGIAAKIIDETHPDYDLDRIVRLRALCEGGKATRRIMRDLLPRMPREPSDRYQDRVKRAFYLNYSGPICNFYASYLFSKPPRVEVEGSVGDWYSGDTSRDEPGFIDNVDGKASTWSAFWRERLIDAFVGGCSYVWINLPEGPEEARLNRGEQEKAGDLDAYLVPVTPEEVINWEEDRTGGLVWIMLKQCLELRPDITKARETVTRWTFVSSTEVRVWEWRATPAKPTPGPEDIVDEVRTIEHGIGRLPIVRMELPKGFWLMEQLHDPAMATFFAENDLGWASYNTAHAILTITSKWEGDAPPVLGDGYYLHLNRDKQGEDKAAWLEIDGASHNVLLARAGSLRQELYRVANQLALSGDQNAGQAARSGESKAMDYQSVAIVAGEFGSIILSAMRQTIRLVSEARDDKASPKVTGLEGYEAVDAAGFIDAATIAQPLVKSETFHRETAKAVARHTLGDSLEKETLATIQAEIDAADYSVDTFAPYTPPKMPKASDTEEGDEEDDDE